MLNKITKLSFIIGTFFTLVSIILLVGHYVSADLASNENLYTGVVFLVFGLFMMFVMNTRD